MSLKRVFTVGARDFATDLRRPLFWFWLALLIFFAWAFSSGRGLIQSGDSSEGARHVVRTVRALPEGYQQSAVVRGSAARALEMVPAGAASVPAVAEARELLALPPAADA